MSTPRDFSSSVPVLETERLRLRGHRHSDFADSVTLWADPVVVRHITKVPSTEEQTWWRFLRYLGHWQATGYGYWVVEEKATGRFAGEAGFADYKRNIDPPFDGAPEAGWVMAPWCHGRGFATEAVAAFVAWGDEKFSRTRTVCMIEPEHGASIRVAEKTGYRQYAETDYMNGPVLLFER